MKLRLNCSYFILAAFRLHLSEQVLPSARVQSLNAFGIFPTEEPKMKREGRRPGNTRPSGRACVERAKALALLFIVALASLASSCATAKNENAESVARPTVTDALPQPSMNANTSAGTVAYGNYDSAAKEEPGVGERYAEIDENPFLEASRAPLSTFSVDVDT